MPIPEPGIYPNTPRSVYDTWDIPSYSTLKKLLDVTPAKWKFLQEHPKEPSDAIGTGDFIDSVMYAPERVKEDFYTRPPHIKTRRGKEWEKHREANEGKTFVDPDVYANLEDMANAIMSHPTGKAFLSAKFRQLAVVWDDPTGIRVKGLLDSAGFEMDGWQCIGDAKSTSASADDATFSRVARSMHYAMQAYMYTTGLNIHLPFKRRWIWMVIEQDPPFEINTIHADDDTMADGEADFRLAIAIYENCLETGVFPSFSTKSRPLIIPGWRRKELGLT